MAFVFHFLAPPEGLLEYAQQLLARRGTGAVVPREAVSVGGWSPQAGDCHMNVMAFTENRPEYLAVHGWLLFDLGGQAGWVRFAAHSVVRDALGDLIDITPSAAPAYPFIEANLSTDEFKEVLAQLEETHGTGFLDVVCPAGN